MTGATPGQLSVEDLTLTPTLELRSCAIDERYRDVIDALCAKGTQTSGIT